MLVWVYLGTPEALLGMAALHALLLTVPTLASRPLVTSRGCKGVGGRGRAR